MVSVEKAVDIILANSAALSDESVQLFDVPGRFLKEDVIAREHIPPADNSAMDGYAVIAMDTRGASVESPVSLEIIDEVKAGDPADGITVNKGGAARIMTGAPLPSGADTVVIFEDTREEQGKVHIFAEYAAGENIRRAGEDIARGSVVLRDGQRLGPAEMGLLASLNLQKVQVYRQPRVAIVSTGDEISEVGAELEKGHIRNSNAYTLYGEILNYGAVPHYLGIARDDPVKTRNLLMEALRYDICVTTGGVSLGRYDFVKEAVTGLGVEILFDTINMKPGKPCVFGKKGSTLFFGLPGNPVSTMVSFVQFVRPAILRMMGARHIEKPLVRAILEEGIRKKPDRTHFIRGIFTLKEGVFHVSTTGPQGSGILKSMSHANCLIIVPAGVSRLEAGQTVDIQLIYHREI